MLPQKIPQTNSENYCVLCVTCISLFGLTKNTNPLNYVGTAAALHARQSSRREHRTVTQQKHESLRLTLTSTGDFSVQAIAQSHPYLWNFELLKKLAFLVGPAVLLPLLHQPINITYPPIPRTSSTLYDIQHFQISGQYDSLCNFRNKQFLKISSPIPRYAVLFKAINF